MYSSQFFSPHPRFYFSRNIELILEKLWSRRVVRIRKTKEIQVRNEPEFNPRFDTLLVHPLILNFDF